LLKQLFDKLKKAQLLERGQAFRDDENV